jgi:ABC-type cobalamin/Fe3+-siderophores transport system ATPase subunit
MKTEISGIRMVNGVSKPLKITGLNKINVFFGKNGTGKSSFLRNIYQSDDANNHLVVPERGGDIIYSSGHLDQENDFNQRKNVRNKDDDYAYRNRAISRTMNILNHQGYKSMVGGGVGKVKSEDITNIFRVFLPEFKVKFGDNAPHSLEIYRENNGTETRVTNASQLSSGQKEAITLAADIITQAVLWDSSQKTILIDEPDAHLHTDLANRFAIFISEVADKFNVQIIIATHSPGLISSLLNLTSGVGIICFDENSDSIAAVKKDDAAIFTNLLSVELSLAVVLGRKIIIVEGNDDFLVWNQAARSQSFKDIALIQANGGDILQYKKNAEKILASVMDVRRFGVTILDGDGKNNFTNEADDSLPCERLNCCSLENLLLSNEILSVMKDNANLIQELDLIKSKENTTHLEKAEIDAIIDNKQTSKISKELIKKIHNNIDTHAASRDWRILIGKKLGSGRPVGELATFLGENIINYIWGNV